MAQALHWWLAFGEGQRGVSVKGWNPVHVLTLSAVFPSSPALQSWPHSTLEAKGEEALIPCSAEASSQLFA